MYHTFKTSFKQEVSDDLGICVLNLKIIWEKSKLLDHMIKRSFDFVERRSSLDVTTLPDLVAIGIVEVNTKHFYHVTSRVQRAVWLNGLKFLI